MGSCRVRLHQIVPPQTLSGSIPYGHPILRGCFFVFWPALQLLAGRQLWRLVGNFKRGCRSPKDPFLKPRSLNVAVRSSSVEPTEPTVKDLGRLGLAACSLLTFNVCCRRAINMLMRAVKCCTFSRRAIILFHLWATPKTHLMHAVGRYLPSQIKWPCRLCFHRTLVNEYIDAIQNKRLRRLKIPQRDILLMDDVHFWLGDQMQEEFFIPSTSCLNPKTDCSFKRPTATETPILSSACLSGLNGV